MRWRRRDGLESELRDHLERETEENIERGMSPREARAAALRRFGSVTLITEDVRAVWIPVWIDQLLQDVRSGIRILRRERSFAAAAILSIALGIAGSAVIFGLLDGLVFHPFPIPNADRVVAVGATFPRLSSEEQFVETLSPPEFLDIAASKTIQHVVAFDLGNRNISGGDRPERVFTGLALTDPFGPFGLRPALGRGFTADELLANGPAVAILSDRIWHSRFVGDPNIVGRAIRVNGRPTVVVGVMPPCSASTCGFHGRRTSPASPGTSGSSP
jgi:putative ABC transport system permease protein